MKALLLAAGYGTRFVRDLEQDTSGAYSHLKGVPKPLLPIGLYAHACMLLSRSRGLEVGSLDYPV